MTLLEAISARHSVRSYTQQPIEGPVLEALNAVIDQCRKESGLHLELIRDQPQAFQNFLAHYGQFSNVRNYIILAGRKSADLEEKCGYYGEKIVLYAQTLGLNTCWVALTYGKSSASFALAKGEKLCLVIAIGYGTHPGVAHRCKSREAVMKTSQTPVPEWFLNGVDAALLAPTAMNQQKFMFFLKDNVISAKAGLGFYSKIDLGIVKYHFELGAGKEHVQWG